MSHVFSLMKLMQSPIHQNPIASTATQYCPLVTRIKRHL